MSTDIGISRVLSIPGREALPTGRELHCSQIDRRMGVEKSLEPLAPAGIWSNVNEQSLDDQRDHIKAVVANAACLPRHGQFRLDGKFSIPQPAVMRADIPIFSRFPPRKQDHILTITFEDVSVFDHKEPFGRIGGKLLKVVREAT